MLEPRTDDSAETMWDLHGKSESEASEIVAAAIRKAQGSNVTKIVFVTGRGKHVNAKGKRGTLFSEFPKWLEQSAHAEKIKQVITCVGHYIVYLKPTSLDESIYRVDESVKTFLTSSLSQIRSSAEAGDPYAMVMYGNILEDGEVVKRDIKSAAKYYRLAAEVGYPDGMHEFAACWMFGKGVMQSDEKAQAWLWKAHHAGFIPATVSLAKGYAWASTGYSYDINKAIELHKIAAEASEADSMRFLAQVYLEGCGVERNLKTAFNWQKKAADMGDPKALYNLGSMCRNGWGVPKNESEAMKYFELSAHGGDADAQFVYGHHLLYQREIVQAIDWLELASDNGSEKATTRLLEFDPDNISLLERSAKMGNLESQLHLDKLKGKEISYEDISIKAVEEKFRMLSGDDIMNMSREAKYLLLDKILLHAKAKYKRAAIHYIQESSSICPYAMRRLVYYYERGNGLFKIKKDLAKAITLLEGAAEQNDPIAMVKLGKFYHLGEVCKKSVRKAESLYRHAASEFKYPPAFYFLGVMYDEGDLGDNKKREALQCFRSAIKYEKNTDHVNKYVIGPLDDYQPITELAENAIARIKPSTPNSSRKSILQRGFFNRSQVHRNQSSISTDDALSSKPDVNEYNVEGS